MSFLFDFVTDMNSHCECFIQSYNLFCFVVFMSCRVFKPLSHDFSLMGKMLKDDTLRFLTNNKSHKILLVEGVLKLCS